jgi:hypothetical protein
MIIHCRSASRIPSPLGPLRLSQTRSGITRVDPAPSDRHTGIRFHPIRTDRLKSVPETRASPSDQDLAKPSDSRGAQRRARIE